MTKSRLVWGLLGGTLILYLLTPTFNYYWDGVRFSLDIERTFEFGKAGRLFHQNHLLYSAAGYCLYSTSRLLSDHARALYLLQYANILIGAYGVASCFVLAEKFVGDKTVALAAASLLAVSSVWWRLSTDVDSYVLSVTLIILAANYLFDADRRWWSGAICFGFAALFHQLAILSYPLMVGIVVRRLAPRRRGRVVMAFTVSTVTLIGVVYWACGAFVLGRPDPSSVVLWALSNQSGVNPSWDAIAGLRAFPQSSIGAFVGHDFQLFFRTAGPASYFGLGLGLLVFSAAMAVGAVALFRARGVDWHRGEVVLLSLWCLPYIGFLLFWEPNFSYYRIFYAPALVIACGLAIKSVRGAARGLMVGALGIVVSLALLNGVLYIWPNTDRLANDLIAGSLDMDRLWGSNTTVFMLNATQADGHVEYFSHGVQFKRVPAGYDKIIAALQEEEDSGKCVWLNAGAAGALPADWLRLHQVGDWVRVGGLKDAGRFIRVSCRGPQRQDASVNSHCAMDSGFA